MFRTVRNTSMSSLSLDTHNTAASGPVISMSSAKGSVCSDMPERARPMASDVDDEEAWPARVAPLAG